MPTTANRHVIVLPWYEEGFVCVLLRTKGGESRRYVYPVGSRQVQRISKAVSFMLQDKKGIMYPHVEVVGWLWSDYE